jgi:hypothetical protein
MLLVYSFIFSKVCKYKFYNVFVLFNEFVFLYNWFGFIIVEIVKTSKYFIKPFINDTNFIAYIYSNVKNNNLYLEISEVVLNKFYFKLIKVYLDFLKFVNFKKLRKL